MKTRTHRSNEAGLSTIEVLVAVAVMGIALTPLIAVQAQIAQTHARYQDTYVRSTLQRNALALLADLNPMATPGGEIDMDGVNRLRWTSAPLTEISRSSEYPAGDGPYDIALYRVVAQVFGANDIVRVTLNTDRIGWKRLDTADPGAAFGAPRDPNQLPR